MFLETGALYRAAGLSGMVALAALVVAAVTIALFFGGAGQVFGPINDVFVAIMVVALILPILAVDRLAAGQAGLWLRIVSVGAITGAVLIAVGQLLLVIGVIDLETSFVTGGLGVIPVLVWIVALIVLAFPLGILPSSVGWPAGAAIALIVVGSLVTFVTTGPTAWAAWIAVGVVLAVWLANLSASFLGRAAA
jgi:hypothetical protein